MLFELTVIFLLIAANGVFAGSEISIISVRRSRLEELAGEGRAGARAALGLRAVPERFLATVQVGITVVGATAAAFSGASVAARLAGGLERLGWTSSTAEEVSLAVVVAAVSFLSLVFGELVPKSLALRSGESFALLMARPLQAMAWVARPVVWLLTAASNLVLKPFGDATSFTESRLSPTELQQLLGESAQAGAVDVHSGEIASRALDFARLTAADVMVPRSRMVALARDASKEELRRILLEEGFARMPVYQGSLDDIVGYITIKDVLALVWERDLVVLDDILRPPTFIPDTMSASRVLREMQRRRVPLTIVVDEHGGVAGLITLEDLVEELVGDVASEYEEPEDPVRRQPDGSAIVRGDLPIRDANRALGLELPEGDGWTTVAGLCIALAGRIPQRGAVVESGAASLEVLEASARAVTLVRVRPRPPAPEPAIKPPA